MSEAARRKNKKKGKQQEQLTESVSSCADSFTFLVLGEAQEQSGLIFPLAVLPARDLQKLGLASRDLVLINVPNGRRTVAVCESGGREGLLLSSIVLKSIDASIGDSVTLTSDFWALEASSVRIVAPKEMRVSWQRLLGGLQLEQYLVSIFDGTILIQGDIRKILLNGQRWNVTVVECCGNEATGELFQPWLCNRHTRIQVSDSTHVDTNIVSNDVKQEHGASSQMSGFARVGGLRAIVEELREAVQLPLEHPERYRALGIGPPRGVLLYGPPGTGKTLLARSLGEELSCPVELCAATDLVGGGVGDPEEQIKTMFERCRKRGVEKGTGVLLFIDEIDAVCPKRDDSSEVERRMVAAFLVALDGTNSNDGIVVLGATNRPDAIDIALRRAGRLEREIEVGVPSAEERFEIINVHLSPLQNNLTTEERRELARRCHGYVGADLRSVCLSAARTSLVQQRQVIGLEDCVAAMRLVPPSALKELLVEVPETRWSDIGGYEDTKGALREAVEWPIKKAWAFEALRIDPPRGILLYGPPGCSKTMMAKAVATESEMNFVSIKGPELFSKYVGDSERAVRDVFRKARTAAPCVIFFDEIDAVGASRDSDGAGGVASRVLAQLLTEMDGIWTASSHRFVVVLAATNRPHVLDPALLRPGRFDRLVHVPLPDEDARRQIFDGKLKGMQADETITAAELAKHTGRCSGAEIVMICREAALFAIRDALGSPVVDANSGGNNQVALPKVRSEHLKRAMAAVRPRIDDETVRFYQEFERRMRDA